MSAANAPAGFFSGTTGLDTPPRTRTRAITLTPEQARAFDAATAWVGQAGPGDNFIVGGFAGTGKTTLLAALAGQLEEDGRSVAYVAPTGRAALVLSAKMRAAGVDVGATTIHSFLYHARTNEKGELVGWDDKGKSAHEPEPPPDLIIVDEASMVTEKILADLQALGVPILLVGDPGQLPPIEGPSVITTPNICLMTIHRQAEGNPIIAMSRAVRETGKLDVRYVDGNAVTLGPASDESITAYIGAGAKRGIFGRYRAAAGSLLRTHNGQVKTGAMLCFTNVCRQRLNKAVRWELGFKGPVPEQGELVLCVQNTRQETNGGGEVRISNGMRGTVLSPPATMTEGGVARVALDISFHSADGEQERAVFSTCRAQYGHPKPLTTVEQCRLAGLVGREDVYGLGALFDFGYALTVHKSQGSEWDDVGVVVDRNDYHSPDYRRWLYTAVTRAAKRLTIWAPDAAVARPSRAA